MASATVPRAVGLATPAPPGRLLLNRDFVLVLQGQVVSQLGSQVFLVAIVLWLQQNLRSASLLGLLMATASVTAVLFGPLGGALADRHSRRTLLVLCDLGSGAALLALAAALRTWPGGETPAIVTLFLVTFVISALGAIFQPAVQALVPDLVDERRVNGANALVQASFRGVALVAQGVGGLLFVRWGAALVALVDGLTYLFSGASTAFVRVASRPARASGGTATLRRDLVAGVAYVRGVPGLLALFSTAALLQFFLVPFSVLLPFYVSGRLGVGPDWYGYLMAAAGTGALLGYLGAGGVRLAGAARARLVGAALVAMALALLALAFISDARVALAAVGAVGVCDGLVNVHLVSLLQTTTPGAMRGRVFGLLRTLGGVLAPLGMLAGGVAADLLGRDIPPIYAACGSAVLLLALFLASNRACREFLAQPAAEMAA